MKPLPLDALTLPLRGSRLIEASAGTGKTWTIAALYLRLVLGHGADDADGRDTRPPRALVPGEILVMTFTRAATRELSDRIRARLAEAARCFRGEAEPAAQDHFLRALIGAYPESPDSTVLRADGDAAVPGAPRSRLAAAHRLALAAEAMDDAAVHTIDAWCQRMLLEHAFDSGQLFDEELVADELQLQREAVLDYWRREVYPLDGAPLDALLKLWPDAEALSARLARLPERGEGLGDFEGAGLSLGGWLQRQVEALRALKLGWAERAERLRAWLHAQQATKTFNGNKLRATSIDAWCAAIALWASEPGAEAPELDEKQWWRLSAEGLVDALAKGQPLPALPPEIDDLAALGEALAARMTLGEALMRHAAAGVGQQLAALKRRQGRFGFADLQARLARALAGPSGARLRERIVGQYPAVLIDEFQDTSPLQYRLFDRLYDVAADAPQTLLLLIGDPKQSIYGFRGADIYSYLAARQATAGRLHMLGTNHRSTQALVDAVNRVFAQAEAGWPAAQAVVGEPAEDFGAFALPQVGRHALPFEPVAARGRREVLVASIGGSPPAPLPALNLQWLPKALKAEPLRRAQAEHAAGQMLALLEDPTVGFREGDEGDEADEASDATFRRLRPGDVAVLVRSRREAQAIRRALGRRGLRSVYLSDQDSVLRSPEAADLLRWLQAVAEPLDAPRVRAAFATATLGLSAAQLLALRDDEDAWEDRLALLQQLRSVWRRQGVLAMLMRSLHALDLPARWLAGAVNGHAGPAGSADGERRLTNWLHLGELLQSAAATLEGEAALIRWLAEEIQAEAGSADERIVRLESDADLIQVVTVHKSKGLEYPLVFLPFAQACWPVDRRGRQVLALPGEGEDGAPVAGRQLVFKLSDEAIAQADRERLREDLRLLYVALTRARHALWLGVGLPAKGGRGAKAGENLLHLSALGHLLGAGQPMAPAAVGELLGQWVTAAAADGSPGSTALQRLDAPPREGRWTPPAEAGALGEARQLDRLDSRRRPWPDWSVGSFSALVRDLAEPPRRGAAVLAPASIAATDPDLDSASADPARLGDALRTERLREEWRTAAAEGDGDEPAAAQPPVAPDAVAYAAPDAVPDAPSPWHRFPRGALPGNFLHDQLEWLAEEGAAAGRAFADPADPAVQAALARRCERAGYGGERAAQVQAWLQRLLHTPLPPLRGALLDVPERLPEMEFWLPSAALDSARLDAICRAHLLPGRERPLLPPRQLHGLLMGFADLVFEQGGRWWVLDYKSNALGDEDAAYTPAALEAAMLGHRYELQAAIYLLALHRLLRARLGEAYDPAAHLGGAVYLFLRGIAAPGAGCVHLPADVALLDALDAALGANGWNAQETTR